MFGIVEIGKRRPVRVFLDIRSNEPLYDRVDIKKIRETTRNRLAAGLSISVNLAQGDYMTEISNEGIWKWKFLGAE